MSPYSFPAVLRSNAFTGTIAAEGELAADARRWAGKKPPPSKPPSLGAGFEEPPDLHCWSDPRVGYGIVLAGDVEGAATDADLPDSVRELIARRNNAPVFRFSAASERYLTNYASGKDFEIAQSDIGNDGIPQYLLIIGGPEKIPWRIQFQLDSRRFAGRLPLEGTALDSYIAHLLKDWKPNEIDVNEPLVWSTNHGYPDISELMNHVVARPLHARYSGNPRILEKATLLETGLATAGNLFAALKKKLPGLIVSTSHGLVAPLENPSQIAGRLGLLVDQNYRTVDPAELLQDWNPNGAIWYAHACCSAGTDGARQYQELAKSGSTLAGALAALKSLGPAVAPLPVGLLSAKKPARAFIGHVEPTFDCTLRNSDTGQLFTKPIIDALYTQLLQRNSAGYAMQYLLGPLGSLNAAYKAAQNSVGADDDAYARMFAYALRGSDVEGTVLLGDPTVALPNLS